MQNITLCMRTWREVRKFASQRFRLTPEFEQKSDEIRKISDPKPDSKILEQERSRSLWLHQSASSARSALSRTGTLPMPYPA